MPLLRNFKMTGKLQAMNAGVAYRREPEGPSVGSVLNRWMPGLSIVLAIALCGWLILKLRMFFSVDDAYMFLRYAGHLKHGLGISWNPDAIHTYGLTSLPWFAVVLLLSYLPLNPTVAIVVASWATFVAALCLLTLGMSRQCRSEFFKSPWNIFPIIVLPLLLSESFLQHTTNGMDTMLSFLVNAALALTVLSYVREATSSKAVLIGLLGALAYFVRPENGLCAVLLPVLAWLFLARSRRWKHLLQIEFVMLGMIGLQLLWARYYFHTPFPLPFYMKARHGYKAYVGAVSPLAYLYGIAGVAALYGAVIVFFGRRRHIKPLVVFLLPVLLTYMYLETVTQIMGSHSRYYVPFLPFMIVPCLGILDEAFCDKYVPSFSSVLYRIAAFGGLIVLSSQSYAGVAVDAFNRHFTGKVMPWPQPQVVTRAQKELPELDWFPTIRMVSDGIIRGLPSSATVATSEVGYIGYSGLQRKVIDIVGLNDTHIALHGFDMKYLLEQKPDLIWLPTRNYTFQRSMMLSDPELFKNYIIIYQAFSYSIAIRKDSPDFALIMSRVNETWRKCYPGADIDDYIVQSIRAN